VYVRMQFQTEQLVGAFERKPTLHAAAPPCISAPLTLPVISFAYFTRNFVCRLHSSAHKGRLQSRTMEA
jgi:hypothetical protein